MRSIIGLKDESGNTLLEYAYDGFGKAYVKTSAGKVSIDEYTGSNYGNDRLFTSREYDKSVRLYYYRARYYSAEQGRFISRDPLGIADDINLYSYVGNNPLNYSDPMGLYSVGDAAKWFFVGQEVAAPGDDYQQVENEVACNNKNLVQAENDAREAMGFTDAGDVVAVGEYLSQFSQNNFQTNFENGIPIAIGFALPFVSVKELRWANKLSASELKELERGAEIINTNESIKLLDRNTILEYSEDFTRTNKKYKGAQIYKNSNGNYYYRDTFHEGAKSHLEVFNKNGNHLGEANPITGELIPGSADKTKSLDKDLR